MSDPTRSGERLVYRDVHGRHVEVKAIPEGEDPAPAAQPLRARRVRLDLPESAQPVRYLGLRAGADRATGYEQIDNEVLAGLRLARLALADDGYPPELSRLVGYDADVAEPYALLEPYRGRPVRDSAGKLLPRERVRFQISLLTGVRWLGAAGIGHRHLTPDTVRWDGQNSQITDFSLATLFGVPRTVVGAPPWWAPEQRPNRVSGLVSDRDDLWAVGRLIHFVITGEELEHQGQLQDTAGLPELLDGIFGPPEQRPSSREVLRRLGAVDPLPRALGLDRGLERGRAEFFAHRARKHPQLAVLAPAPVGGVREPKRAESGEPEPPTKPFTTTAPKEPPGGTPARWRLFATLTGVVALLAVAIGLWMWK
jgi:serine/threonine protein kinase